MRDSGNMAFECPILDNVARIIEKFTDEIKLDRFSLYMMDYGAPIGFRIATSRPERIDSLIIQDGQFHRES